jgi:ADP-heptose:LPS heptosyltransferase
VIANTEVFIGADSGIMHLASASLTPTVGLFSITNENVYAPYNNNSIGINTEKSGIDDWIVAITNILKKHPHKNADAKELKAAY